VGHDIKLYAPPAAQREGWWRVRSLYCGISRDDERYLSRAEMEHRRVDGVKALRAGEKPGKVAKAAGVSRTTVYRWMGLDPKNIPSRKAPGRPFRLTPAQAERAKQIYAAGPGAAGFTSPMFTTAQFAAAVYWDLDVRYSPDAMGRVMHRLGLAIGPRGGTKGPGSRQKHPRVVAVLDPEEPLAASAECVREMLAEAGKEAGA